MSGECDRCGHHTMDCECRGKTTDTVAVTDSMTIKDIVAGWLREHGYDGLTDNDECGCTLEDFMPCGEASVRYCTPAVKGLCPDSLYDFYMVSKARRDADRKWREERQAELDKE